MTTATSREIEISLISGSKISGKISIPDCLDILDDPSEKPREGFGCLRILTPKDGDKRVVWDRADFTQIREAKDMFDGLIAQGLVPYRVGINGKASSEVMSEFDPYAEEVLFLPIKMVAGG